MGGGRAPGRRAAPVASRRLTLRRFATLDASSLRDACGLALGGEADRVEQPRATAAGGRPGHLGRLRRFGRRGDVGDDLLSHAVEQRQRARYYTAGPVDVLDAGADELGVSEDLGRSAEALLQVGRDRGSAAIRPRTGRPPARPPASTMTMTVRTTSAVMTSPFRAPGRGTDGAAGPRRARPRRRPRPAG